MRHLLFALLTLATPAAVLAQAPRLTIIRNAASFLPPGVPSYAIAQGSVFALDGVGIGPEDPVKVEASHESPLKRDLEGVSVKVTVGETIVDAILYSVSAKRVTAILPSATPVGTATVTLSYNGQASNGLPFQVVSSAFGFTTFDGSGVGAGVVRIKDSELVGFLNSANPGMTLMFEGTGLGPDPNDETIPLDGVAADMPDAPFEFFFGSIKAEVLYRGRSNRPGWDRVEVIVPEGIAGCYTTALAKMGNFISNTITVAVAASGKSCEEFGYAPSDLEGLFAKDTVNAAWYYLGKHIAHIPAIGTLVPAMTSTSDLASGQFVRFDKFQFTNFGGRGDPGYGSCVVSYSLGPEQTVVSVLLKPLDAGPFLTLQPPTGAALRLAKATDSSGGYAYTSSVPQRPLFLPDQTGGTFKFTAPGGEDVAAHEATIETSAPVRWTNRTAISDVNRAAGLEVTWTGGDPNSFIIIAGGSSNGANPPLVTAFNCGERVSAGKFTIPREILSSLVPSFTVPGPFSLPTGQLNISTFKLPAKFEAPGIDVGNISYQTSETQLVNYR